MIERKVVDQEGVEVATVEHVYFIAYLSDTEHRTGWKRGDG